MNKHILRPGGPELTKKALEIAKFNKGDKILDIGCGTGESATLLTEEYGLAVTGIDKDEKNIAAAKENCKEVDFSVGDGEMLDFTSRSFDGVLMECTLSLMPAAKEAIHEAYCMLKDGGKLIISDLYWKEPSEEQKKALEEAKTYNNRPREHGECQTEERVPDSATGGAFIVQEIMDELAELEMKVISFEDQSDALVEFAAGVIFEYGSFEEYAKQNPCALSCDLIEAEARKEKDEKSDLGYFLLVAEKNRG